MRRVRAGRHQRSRQVRRADRPVSRFPAPPHRRVGQLVCERVCVDRRALRTGHPGHQFLRRERGDDRQFVLRTRDARPAAGCAAADWPQFRQHEPLRPRSTPRSRAAWRFRRTLYRRPRPVARLPEPPRPHSRAVRTAPVRGRAWGAAVPHRRSRAVPAERRHRVARPDRRPGQAARLPHRSRRDRISAHAARLGGEGRGGASRGRRRRQAPGRLRRRRTRSGDDRSGAAAIRPREAARVHGAVGDRGDRGAAAAAERQDQPPRAAGARGEAAVGRDVCRADQRYRGPHRGRLEATAAARNRRRPRQLLRSRRPLAAGHPAAQPAVEEARLRAHRARSVRPSDHSCAGVEARRCAGSGTMESTSRDAPRNSATPTGAAA